jgi:hypothetical protein
MTTILPNIKALEAVIDFTSLVQKINIDKSAIESNANRLFSYAGDITPEVQNLITQLELAIDNTYKGEELKQRLDNIKSYIASINS